MGRQIRYAIIVAGVVLIAALIYVDLPEGVSLMNDSSATASSTIQLKDRTIDVFVADTPALREKGLSGREGLGKDEAMLFVFSKDGRYAFWMKDMHFAIDILWISSEGIVVDIQENVLPATYPTTFEPRTAARYVVELSAGWVEKYNIVLGDVVRL